MMPRCKLLFCSTVSQILSHVPGVFLKTRKMLKKWAAIFLIAVPPVQVGPIDLLKRWDRNFSMFSYVYIILSHVLSKLYYLEIGVSQIELKRFIEDA